MTEMLPKNTAKVEIDLQEKSLNGAPQGDLYQVQVEPEALKWIVYPSILNLRSVMVRNGLLCLEDIVYHLKTDTAVYLDEMVPLLLTRTGSEKQFIRKLTARVLENIVQVCGSVDLFQLFLSTGVKEKKSPQLTSTATQYALMCMEKSSSNDLTVMMEENYDSILNDMRLLLNCRAVDGKIATRKCLQILRQTLGVGEEKAFMGFVQRQLSPSAESELLQASEKPKPKTSGSVMRRQNKRLRARVVAQQQKQPEKDLSIDREDNALSTKVIDTCKPQIEILTSTQVNGEECRAKVA
ncbi:hypothetical protein ABG067_001996 [Albugo candida]